MESLSRTGAYFMSIVVKPQWETLILLVAILRICDRVFENIWCFSNAHSEESKFLPKKIGSSISISIHATFCTSVLISIVPALVTYRVFPNGVLQVGTALFLLLLDVDAFVTRVKLLCSAIQPVVLQPRWSTLLSIFRKFSHIREVNFWTFGFQPDHLINLLLRICIFGVGMTSGHTYLEYLCAVTMLQQILYTLTLVTAVPLLVLPLRTSLQIAHIFGTKVKGQAYKHMEYATRIGRRVRSSSCSVHETVYPERCHVNVQELIQKREELHTLTPTQDRIKYITIVGLFVLYMHNRFFPLHSASFDHCGIKFVEENKGYIKSVSNNTWSLISRWLGGAPLEYKNFNLIFFLLIGVLLYYRAKLYAYDQRKLLDLDIKPQVEDEWQSVGASDSLTSDLSKSDKSVHPQSDKSEIATPSLLLSNCSKPLDLQSLPEISSMHLTSNNSVIKTVDGFSSRSLNDQRRTKQPTAKLSASDVELLQFLSTGDLKTRELESVVGNYFRAVELRRLDLARLLSRPQVLDRLPYKGYDYRHVHGQCCEEVIGYVPIPVGKVGPLLLDGHSHYVPLATTEGCLVASTNRGCRALFLAGGVRSVLFRDQMTRAPVVWFSSIREVVQCIAWIESSEGFAKLKTMFEQTSAHIQLLSIFTNPCGHYLHIRFAARTGEAMGMNMVSKATNSALHELRQHFPSLQVISLSGNMCTDKKPAAINTILGRGKSVLAEAHLSATVLAQVLHTTASRLVRLSHAKNWTGSAMAGCSGMAGSNAHAANIVAGIFAATGQDLAQVVDASACLTQFELGEDDSLLVTVTMPCIEVGTIGGGTRLPPQQSCLDLLDLSVDRPTEHLARIVAGTVLAGELNLMAALDTDDLVTAHLRLNRAVNNPICNSNVINSPSASSSWANGSVPVSTESTMRESLHPTM